MQIRRNLPPACVLAFSLGLCSFLAGCDAGTDATRSKISPGLSENAGGALIKSPPVITRLPDGVVWPKYVAHAMGGVDDRTYTNAYEAWQRNYEAGCRLFEVDFWETSDRQLVAFHDGYEQRFGIPADFTHDDFMSVRLDGEYKPLDAEAIGTLLKRAPDWKIVTDTKSDLRASLTLLAQALSREGVQIQDRVVPQIYNASDDLDTVIKMGFAQVILTLYLTNLSDDEVIQAVNDNPVIAAVTMSTQRWNATLVGQLKKMGVESYVHTVNGSDTIDTYLSAGVHGVYTDFGCRPDNE